MRVEGVWAAAGDVGHGGRRVAYRPYPGLGESCRVAARGPGVCGDGRVDEEGAGDVDEALGAFLAKAEVSEEFKEEGERGCVVRQWDGLGELRGSVCTLREGFGGGPCVYDVEEDGDALLAGGLVEEGDGDEQLPRALGDVFCRVQLVSSIVHKKIGGPCMRIGFMQYRSVIAATKSS